MGENNNEKITITVELFGDAKKDFLELKAKLRIENNTDVLRWATSYANKRMIFK